MREPVGGADDKSVERVAPVEAGSAGCSGIGGVWPFGEVGRPALLGITDDFAVFVTLVGVAGDFDVGVLGLGEGFRVGDGFRICEAMDACAVGVACVVRKGSDAHSELDLLSEPPAQRVGDWLTQMPFDLILYEAARNRQQSKPLNDGEWLDKVEPGPLLGSQGSDESCAISR